MSSDCALNNACYLVFWASVCSERRRFVCECFPDAFQRISALEDTITGLRQEPNTPNVPAVGLRNREKRSTSANASPSPSGLFIRRNLELGNFKRTMFPQRTTLEIKDEFGVHDLIP